MKSAIYNIGTHRPNEEVFMAGMLDMILQTALSALFGPLVAILALYVGQPMNVVRGTVANLGEAEAVHV